MARLIDHLNEQALEDWRVIKRAMWLAKCTDKMYDDTEKEKIYISKLKFEWLCVREFDIDDTRKWEISERTGAVYYIETN